MSKRAWDEELVDNLTELADPVSPNRAALSHLRRGLEAPLDYTLGRVGWLFHRVPESKDDLWLRCAVLASGLFAWVKGDSAQSASVNFGEAFGTGLTLEQKQQRDKRFIDLLDTDTEELPYKLRQAMTLIARDRVPLDWVLLIRHLAHWSNPDRWVQIQWARGYWSVVETQTEAVSE
jgi:CRISPR type I-E-associated protein CasB/Cse2